MPVLVAYATDHGSTREIAERIAARLRDHSVEAVVASVESPGELDGYDAVVVGSAIHNGRWLPAANALIDSGQCVFRGRPVWLFSVATIGATSSGLSALPTWLFRKWGSQPRDLAALRAQSGAVDHRLFAGVIRPEHWGPLGTFFMGGSYGDHRDWDDIDAWASHIAARILAAGTVS